MVGLVSHKVKSIYPDLVFVIVQNQTMHSSVQNLTCETGEKIIIISHKRNQNRVHETESNGGDDCAETGCSKAETNLGKVVTVVVNEFEKFVLAWLHVFILIVSVQNQVIFLVFFQKLINDSLFFVQVSSLLVFDINLKLFILNFTQNFKTDLLSIENGEPFGLHIKQLDAILLIPFEILHFIYVLFSVDLAHQDRFYFWFGLFDKLFKVIS